MGTAIWIEEKLYYIDFSSKEIASDLQQCFVKFQGLIASC